MINNQLDAIVNVVDYVYGNKMSDTEKIEQKMNIIKKDNELLFKFFDEYRIQEQKDIERYSELLSKLTLLDYSKMNEYVQRCISSAISNFVLPFNKNNEQVKIYFNFGNLCCEFTNLNNEQKIELSKYLSNLNLKLLPSKAENSYVINIDDMNISLQEALIKLQKIALESLKIINGNNNVNNKK